VPYGIGQSAQCPSSKPWAVKNTATGAVVGCHPTKQKAQKQLAALQINVPDAKKSEEPWWLTDR
jgi:hypothetical protein